MTERGDDDASSRVVIKVKYTRLIHGMCVNVSVEGLSADPHECIHVGVITLLEENKKDKDVKAAVAVAQWCKGEGDTFAEALALAQAEVARMELDCQCFAGHPAVVQWMSVDNEMPQCACAGGLASAATRHALTLNAAGASVHGCCPLSGLGAHLEADWWGWKCEPYTSRQATIDIVGAVPVSSCYNDSVPQQALAIQMSCRPLLRATLSRATAWFWQTRKTITDDDDAICKERSTEDAKLSLLYATEKPSSPLPHIPFAGSDSRVSCICCLKKVLSSSQLSKTVVWTEFRKFVSQQADDATKDEKSMIANCASKRMLKTRREFFEPAAASETFGAFAPATEPAHASASAPAFAASPTESSLVSRVVDVFKTPSARREFSKDYLRLWLDEIELAVKNMRLPDGKAPRLACLANAWQSWGAVPRMLVSASDAKQAIVEVHTNLQSNDFYASATGLHIDAKRREVKRLRQWMTSLDEKRVLPTKSWVELKDALDETVLTDAAALRDMEALKVLFFDYSELIVGKSTGEGKSMHFPYKTADEKKRR
jgi:hypothetical protein